jgi:DNA-binding MarR family transcriptional regulator
MKREETVDFHLKSTWHNISRYYNTIAAQHGTTMSIGFILLTIDIKEGTPSTKLGPQMGMTPRSLVRSLSQLEKNNLIYRQSDATDKRKVRIFLTQEGKDAREIAKESVLHFNTSIRSNLSEEELENFFGTMQKINSTLNNLTT